MLAKWLHDRVLITGGAGFIGTHTAVALLRAGYSVRLLDSLVPPVHQPGVPPPWLPDDAELLIGDVRNKAVVARALRQVDLVLHLAAYQDYLPDFSTFVHTNVVGTAMLYEVMVEDHLDVKKVVIASSQAVYGEGPYKCADHGPFHAEQRTDDKLGAGQWEVECCICGRPSEWQPVDEIRANPESPYGLSKYMQELIGYKLGRRYQIPTTCLRYSITQGKWQSPKNAYSGICRIFTQRVLAGKAPIVFEDGKQVRDYVYVGDVARANLMALFDSRMDFESYNVGGHRPIQAIEYAEIVIRMLGRDVRPAVPGIYRFGDTRHVFSDSAKLRALGWEATVDVQDIIQEYAGWFEATQAKEDNSDDSIRRMLERGTLRRLRVSQGSETNHS